MTCADVMTSNPKWCEPGDSAVRAAQMMRAEDIGPVLVVDNNAQRQLIGIVTDRDLAVQVVAAGRDPNTTRLEEIMTRRLVTCHEDDDAHDAMEAMRRNQIRRIPVVDRDNRLVGIIAQADIARRMDESETGGVVEDISQPGQGPVGRVFDRIAQPSRSSRGGTDVAGALMAGGVGMMLGATLMCLFDPSRGQARRERVGGAARSIYNQSADLVGKSGRIIRRRSSEPLEVES